MLFCEYKDSLGVPGEGVHFHVFGIAIVDVIMTIFGAFLLSYLFNESFVYLLIALFILSVFFHFIFCVDTTIMKLIKSNICN